MTEQDAGTPPIACTLSADELGSRSAEWSALLAEVTERQPTTDGMRLRLPNAPEVAAKAADLIAREVQCCAFFTFVLTVDADAVWLEVTTPPDGRDVVDRLFG